MRVAIDTPVQRDDTKFLTSAHLRDASIPFSLVEALNVSTLQ